MNRISEDHVWITIKPDIIDADAIDCRVQFFHELISGLFGPERKERAGRSDLLRTKEKFRLSVTLDDGSILIEQQFCGGDGFV